MIQWIESRGGRETGDREAFKLDEFLFVLNFYNSFQIFLVEIEIRMAITVSPVTIYEIFSIYVVLTVTGLSSKRLLSGPEYDLIHCQF